MVKKTVEIETRVTGDSQAKSKLGSLGNFIKSKLVITLGDLVRIGKSVVNFFVQASQKAQEQEEVTNKLNTALKTQGIYTAQTSKALQEQASALQKVTTFGDEAIISLQAQLISFGVLPKDIERVTKATLDLAVAQGMDLGSAGNLLAKSLGSSTNALARYGIEITGAVGSSERLDTAITNISTKFGGQASARTETMRGATEQLKNTWGDLQETIMTTNNNAITPYIKGLNDILLKTNEIITSESKRTGGLTLLADLHKNMAIDLKKVADGTLENAKALEQENLARLKSEEAKYKEGSFAKQRAEEGIKQSEARIKAIDDEEKRRSTAEQNEIKRAEETKKRAEDKKQQDEQQLEYNKMMVASRDAMIAKDIEVKDSQIKTAQETSDLLASITEDGGKTIGDAIKKQLSGQIDAWMATEIAKAQLSAPLTFGASLMAIAPIIGAGTAGKAAINAVKFAQGGQFETNQATNFNTTSGQTAQVGEKGLERITVEPVGKSQSSGGTMNVTINLGGQELKKVAIALSPYMNAVNKGVI
jgi:hypothetical protein